MSHFHCNAALSLLSCACTLKIVLLRIMSLYVYVIITCLHIVNCVALQCTKCHTLLERCTVIIVKHLHIDNCVVSYCSFLILSLRNPSCNSTLSLLRVCNLEFITNCLCCLSSLHRIAMLHCHCGGLSC